MKKDDKPTGSEYLFITACFLIVVGAIAATPIFSTIMVLIGTLLIIASITYKD